MNQSYIFRILVAANLVLQLLFMLPTSSWYADPLIEKSIILDGHGAILNWETPIISQISMFGSLAASIGMLFFKNWARYLYLILWFYGWIATLLFGLRVIVPALGFIGMTIGTIDGMVLYLAFLSELRLKFKKAV